MRTLKPTVKTMDSRTTITKPTERTRGTTWMTIREKLLRQAPHCAECLKDGKVTPANEVDHILPLSMGGTDDMTNLQGLCYEHHQTKTKQEIELMRGIS